MKTDRDARRFSALWYNRHNSTVQARTKSDGGVGAVRSEDAGRREDHENDRRIPMGVGDIVAAAREWGAPRPSLEC